MPNQNQSRTFPYAPIAKEFIPLMKDEIARYCAIKDPSYQDGLTHHNKMMELHNLMQTRINQTYCKICT